MKYQMKLKTIYQDVMITKGGLTFKASQVNPLDYYKYASNGFSELFEDDIIIEPSEIIIPNITIIYLNEE